MTTETSKQQKESANKLISKKMNDLTTSSVRKLKKQKRRKVIRHRKLSEENHNELVLRVKQRYGSKSKKSKDELKEPLIDANNGQIEHPISYQRIMTRTFESHFNKILQPETPEDLLPSNWVCAVCFRPSANLDHIRNIQINISLSKSRGELFGPYFIQLSSNFQPPEILLPRQMLEQYNQGNFLKTTNGEQLEDNKSPNPSKIASKSILEKRNSKRNGNANRKTLNGKLDLWFHGECALEVPELFLIGGRFPNLEHQIAKYWESIGMKT